MTFIRPSEITNQQNLVSNKPILLIEFADLNYHIASQQFWLTKDSGTDGVADDSTGYFSSATAQFVTDNVKAGDIVTVDTYGDYTIVGVINETTIDINWAIAPLTGLTWALKIDYKDLLKNKNSLSLNNSLSENVNNYNSLNSISLTLLDWTALSSAWSTSLTTLKNSAVNIYIKYNTGDVSASNALKIFSGKISDWSIKKDIITLTVENSRITVDELQTLIPTTLIRDTIEAAEYEGGRPVQFGDFSWADDFVFWADRPNKYAYIPYVYTTAAGSMRFEIAEHQMKSLPTAIQLNGNGDTEAELYTFVFRFGAFWAQRLINAAITNTSSGAYMTCQVQTSDGPRPYLPLTEAYDGLGGLVNANDYAEWANCVDGHSSTLVVVSAAGLLRVCGVGAKEKLGQYWTSPSAYVVKLYVSIGTLAYSGGDNKVKIYNRTTGTEIDSYTFVAANANSTVFVTSFTAIIGGSYDCLDNFVISFESDGTGVVHVKNVVISLSLTEADLASEKLYLRCQGRMYEDSWGGRKTTTDVVQNPIDIVELILRNYMSITDISTGRFDALNSFYSSCPAAFTLIDQIEIDSIIRDLMAGYNFSLIVPETDSDSWRVVAPFSSAMVFTQGGGSTPLSADIINEDDNITAGEFDQDPILINSLSVKQNNSNDIYGMVEINCFNVDGNYYGLVSTGSGLKKVINNDYIRSVAAATILLGLIDGWFLAQKIVISLNTFWNCLHRQIGDVVNIRHSEIIEAMLGGGSKNNQKYMIIRIQKKWRPHLISMDAIELK